MERVGADVQQSSGFNERMTIRPAAPPDLPAIERIQSSSRHAAVWAPLDYACNVAEEDGHVVGFVVTRQVTPSEPEVESEVLNLAVDPSYRRQGIGAALVTAAIANAPGGWFLEVRESNIAAIELYKSLGFKPCGRRQNYYNDPPESAIVMSFFS
jgi:ribosomal-protein-alanine N-acetyltransferase